MRRFVRTTALGPVPIALAALAFLAACAEKPASLSTAPMRVISMKPIPNPEPQAPPAHVAAAPPPAPAPAAKAPKTATAKAKPDAAPSHPPSGQATTDAVNPAEAAKLREAGLVELNRGAISRALALLEHANRLDPANLAIRRDLERAQRINKALAASR